jgi:hypothetical protein
MISSEMQAHVNGVYALDQTMDLMAKLEFLLRDELSMYDKKLSKTADHFSVGVHKYGYNTSNGIVGKEDGVEVTSRPLAAYDVECYKMIKQGYSFLHGLKTSLVKFQEAATRLKWQQPRVMDHHLHWVLPMDNPAVFQEKIKLLSDPELPNWNKTFECTICTEKKPVIDNMVRCDNCMLSVSTCYDCCQEYWNRNSKKECPICRGVIPIYSPPMSKTMAAKYLADKRKQIARKQFSNQGPVIPRLPPNASMSAFNASSSKIIYNPFYNRYMGESSVLMQTPFTPPSELAAMFEKFMAPPAPKRQRRVKTPEQPHRRLSVGEIIRSTMGGVRVVAGGPTPTSPEAVAPPSPEYLARDPSDGGTVVVDISDEEI